MTANFPVVFRTKTLRYHRRKILLEREKSLLPAMQVFVEARKKIADTQDRLKTVHEAYKKALDEETRLRSATYLVKMELAVLEKKKENANLKNVKGISPSDAESLKVELASIEAEIQKKMVEVKASETIRDKYFETVYKAALKSYSAVSRVIQRWQRVYETGEEGGDEAKKQRREFVMRCPADDCRGFLSTAYKCGVCEKKTCSECMEVLGEEEHACKPDAVETAKAIKKETRPCPKCGVRIFKISGCDQMWCTVDGCGTAFSWESGQVVTGRVHNPHYYEWMRRNGAGGVAPREPGDIPCGGIPAGHDIQTALHHDHHVTLYNNKQGKYIYDVHRNITEFEERLRDYPVVLPAMYNKEMNVEYLMNKITEEKWQQLLEHNEAKFNRKREIGQILQTLVIATADVFRDFCSRAAVLPTPLFQEWIEAEMAPTLESLRAYTNESFKKLSHTTRMAVPQVDDKWEWVPIRAIYKHEKNTIVGEDGNEVLDPQV